MNNILFKMNPKGLKVLLVFIALLTAASALQLSHFASNTTLNTTSNNTMLQALLQQQLTFQNSINSLVSNLHNISSKVNATANTTDQVLILEHAIITQRQAIATLQQHIIPPFNLSKTSCLQLTPNQQLNMMTQINKAKLELTRLLNLAKGMPVNPETTQLTTDIQQQQTIVLGIESVIHSQCNNASIFSPTIFQSNLYASNWVLGKQTITNLIDQYYQRSLLYTSVNNCPISSPFFNGTHCIQCVPPTPVFDMQMSTCMNCPTGYKLHLTKHLCQLVPHYTNYPYANNYALMGAPAIPAAPSNMTACPSTHPFWNSTNCIKCNLPEFWNVNTSQCVACSGGLIFDVNLKNCTLPQKNTLSYLFGNSSWVTAPGNMSAVLAARASLIAHLNGTNYTICSRSTPYFDGIHCISCPQQFNLTSRLCVNASNGTVFDANIHAYVPLQLNYKTNPNATNYISNHSLPNNTNATYCNISAPFFDGNACINCSSIFPYFDVATLTCVQCSPYKYYDNVTHSCVHRPILWISTNFTNIMASNNTTLASYKAMLYNLVKNNNQSIVQNCAPGLYSNLTHCFPCASGLYFDITNLTCAPCNGTINTTDYHCIHAVTLLSNLNASNLIVGHNQTLTNVSAFYSTIVRPIAYCPSNKPYAVNGTKCIACNASTPYFNLTNYSCQACPSGLVYDALAWTCLKGVHVSNLAVLNYSLVIQNSTLNLTILQQTQIKNANGTPVVNCPASAPLFNGTHCMGCPNGTYYMLSNFSCYTPLNVTNVTALAASNRYIQVGIHTLINVEKAINASVLPVQACPSSTPLYNGTHCVTCNSSQYFNLNNNTCYNPQLASNTSALNATNRYVNLGSYTLANLILNISSSPYPSHPCPSTAPLFNGSQCIACANGSYYELRTLRCIVSRFATNVKALNATGRALAYGQYTLAYLQAQINSSTVPITICPAATPFYNGTNCTACPNGTYYLIETLACYTPIYSSNVSALNATHRVVQLGNHTLNNLNATIAAYPFPTKLCPASAPFLSRGKCINCSSNQWYDLQSRSCYKPLLVSNVTQLNISKSYVQIGNNTLAALNASISHNPYPTLPCPRQAPLYNGTHCLACPAGIYYLLTNDTCYSPLTVSNISYFYQNNNYFDIGNATLLSIATTINASLYPVNPCPSSAPLFNGTGCQACPSGAYYLLGPNNLTNETSYCQFAKNVTNMGALVNYFGNGSYSYANSSTNISNYSLYHKVNLCPSAAPLALNNGSCVACSHPHYYVDLQTMTCVRAVQVSNITALAVGNHYIQVLNYTLVNMELYIKSITLPLQPCPASAPLFNGTHCIACTNGSYYDLQNFTCYTPLLASNITALNATGRYVNIARYTLANMALNESSSPLPLQSCPSSAPLFNGTHCVGCNSSAYYDLKNLKCITARFVSNVPALQSSGRVVSVAQYNIPYLQAQIASSVLPTQVCPASTPFFNGLICVACPVGTYYLIQTLSCYHPVYSSNVNALSSSNRVVQANNYTLTALNASITAQPFPTKPCPSATPFLSGGHCVGCPSGQYYDLQTGVCYKPRKVSNVAFLNSTHNYINVGNATLTTINSSIVSSVYPVNACPTSAPVYNGTGCFACPNGTYYMLNNFTCYTPKNVSNVTALKASKILVINNATISNLAATINASAMPVQECPATAPLFNGTHCLACPINNYYLLYNGTCYVPQNVTNITELYKVKNYINVGNATIANLSATINATVLPVNYCPSATPVFNGSACFACPNGTYYLLNNYTCYQPQNVTNFVVLAASNRYIQVGNHTLINVEKAINASVLPVQACPSSAPLYNGTHCVTCNSSQYFNLNNNTCYNPQLASNTIALSATNRYVNLGSYNLINLANNISSSPYPSIPCPTATPLYNGTACFACPAHTYYDLKNLHCINSSFVSNVAALNATGKVVAIGQYNLTYLQAQINASVLPIKLCPAATPLYNGTVCQACPNGTWYLIETLSCYKPLHSSNVSALNATARVVQVNNYTLANLNATIAAQPFPTTPCPQTAPFLSQGKCINCSIHQWYDLQTRRCYKPKLATNVSELLAYGKFIEIGNYTIANLTSNYSSNPFPVIPCPASAPIYNGSQCLTCPPGTYYILSNFTCYHPIEVSNVSAINATGAVLTYHNYSLTNLSATIKAYPYPVLECPTSFPLFNGSKCVTCPNGTYYLLWNNTCYLPNFTSNLTAILNSGNYIEIANYTIVNLNAQVIASKYPVAYCPSSAPMFNGTNCVACTSGTYYLFLNSSCYTPQYSTNVTELVSKGQFIVVGNYTIANLTANISSNPYPTNPCPASAPLFTSQGCVLCPPGTYYILKNSTCYHPWVFSNVSAMNASGAVLNYNNVSLANLSAQIAAFPYPYLQCPALYPFFNGSICTQCPNGTYYLLYNNTCYVPQFVTNVTHLNLTNLYVDVGTHTLAAIKAGIIAAHLPVMYCPAKRPLFNGTFCIECKPGQFYNLGNLSCQNPNYISNILALKLAGNYLQTASYNISTLQHAVNVVPNPIKQCSPSAPLYTGSTCIVCTSPLIYDLANKKCASCASTYYFNTTLFQCLPSPQYYPNLNNTNWIVNNATGLQILLNMTAKRKLITGASVCPSSTPNYNYNSNSCGACPAGLLWNYHNYTCMACPTGEVIDLTSRTCGRKLYGVYQTNIHSPNLLFNGISYAQYNNTYNTNKLSYPGIKDCPPATPYYDGFNCIACNGSLPLFSMYHQLCSTCPPNAPYDPKTFNCVASNGVVQSPPNIGKMYSSIF